ncbi:hypothetical protein QBC43DRAFT_345419 [Cladorrhinum sp. PSN259]|nr:hypothetical protein QBC43DRAFT_345419 [Cladorrhinum sp. PSN259]
MDQLNTRSLRTWSSSNLTGSTATAYHMVPGLLSAAFGGRQSELEWLRETLNPERQHQVGGRVGIYGMTGVGKTQLLLKYEAAYRKYYTTQFFLSATSRSRLLYDIRRTLETLDRPEGRKAASDSDADASLQILALHDWLSQSTSNWLLLIDNISPDLVDLVQKLVPAEGPGHIMLTSQIRGVVEKIAGLPKLCLHLNELPIDDAVQLLIDVTGVESDLETSEDGANIVRALGFLPHAIQQVGSYIRVNALSFKTFLERYNNTPETILEWDDPITMMASNKDAETDERVAISKHFKLIFDSLEKIAPDAMMVLKLFSFLETEAIPQFDQWNRPELNPGFQASTDKDTNPYLPPVKTKHRLGFWRRLACWIKSDVDCDSSSTDLDILVQEKALYQETDTLTDIFKNPDRRERAIGALCDLSLIRRIQGERLFWMHDLTKRTVRAVLPADNIKQWIAAGITIIYHMMPVVDTVAEERAWVTTCLPTASGIIRKAEYLDFKVSQYACLLALTGLCNLSRNLYSLAKAQFEKARSVYEEHLGPKHPRTITLLHKLAWAIRGDGNVITSEATFREVWEKRKEVLGPKNPATLETLNDLASTIERAGRLKEAETMFQRLYEGHQQVKPDSLQALAAGHNYALCFHNQGRLLQAADMYRAVLKISEERPGVQDEGTLKTMGNYAATLDHDGQNDEASKMYKRALTGFTRVLGYEHMLTLRLRVNMAALLKQQGRFEESDIMLGKCIETAFDAYGEGNVETQAYLYDWGEVWQAKGDLQKARDMFEKLVNGRTGDMIKHPVGYRWIGSWGAVEREMGHLGVAEGKAKEAYTLFEDMLGWHDPYTLMAANDYAEVLQAKGRHGEAWNIHSRCRDSFASLVGKEHPHYAMSLNNLGRLAWVLRPQEAASLFAAAHGVLISRVGKRHYCSLIVLLNMARSKFYQGKFEDSVTSTKDVRTAFSETVGIKHPLVSTCDIVIGIMFASRGDQVSLLTARNHLQAALDAATETKYTASANYFLGVALLALVIRSLGSSPSALVPLLAILGTDSATELSPFDIPGVGSFTANQLANWDSPSSFDFGTCIPLSIGETIKLRWGRKTCWREADKAKLDG